MDRNLDIFENAQISIEPIFFVSDGPSKVNLKDFLLIKCIGLGGFSRVYLV